MNVGPNAAYLIEASLPISVNLEATYKARLRALEELKKPFKTPRSRDEGAAGRKEREQYPPQKGVNCHHDFLINTNILKLC